MLAKNDKFCESSPTLLPRGTEIQPTFFGLESRWCNILGMCDQGTAALGQLFKDAEKDPYAFPWDVMAAQVDKGRSKVWSHISPPNKKFLHHWYYHGNYHLDATIEPT